MHLSPSPRVEAFVTCFAETVPAHRPDNRPPLLGPKVKRADAALELVPESPISGKAERRLEDRVRHATIDVTA